MTNHKEKKRTYKELEEENQKLQHKLECLANDYYWILDRFNEEFQNMEVLINDAKQPEAIKKALPRVVIVLDRLKEQAGILASLVRRSKVNVKRIHGVGGFRE